MAGVDGLVSGLNTTQIISSLMQVERQSGAYLTTGKTASQTMIGVLQSLNTSLATLQTAASVLVPDSITGASGWTATTATSSQTALATATTDATAMPGSTTFTVQSVATAGAAVSSGSVGSLTSAVANGPFVLATGLGALGLASPTAGPTLSTGAHTVTVTQSSAGAALTGAPVADTVTIDASNAGFSVFLDGSSTATTITLAQGTYSRDQLAAEVTRASAGTLTASSTAAGALRLATTHEGSAATLALAAPSAALGLTDTSTTASGTDAVVSLDGVATTVSSLTRGAQLTLSGAGGDSLVFTLGGGLRAGTASASLVDVAAGASMTAVVSAINGAGAGVRATAVQVSPTAYRLQLNSMTTGAGSDVTLGGDAFPNSLSTLGSMVQLQAGSDTVLRVGTGPGAYDATSPTATVAGLLPGVTITATKADPTTPVTLTVDRDSAGIADKVQAMVKAANDVLAYLNAQSGYDTTTKTGGPLLGSSMARDLAQRLTDTAVGTAASTPGLVGVGVARDGSLTFDRATFLAAYTKDPNAVAGTLTTMASALSDTVKAASDPTNGYVTGQLNLEQEQVRDYTDQIANFEVRMSMRQDSLQRQYAALETMLGSLQSQSQWLTGQIASLPTPSTGKN
ncbi:flagellar filament capping protein FliD [Nostocoides sp. HKS02]|uniref:flagellar filament capping protein FliD n=1 Tax=Nostocoides sp. HKS02 TaxID=1813880 RepID=UPI0012B4D845|nr:flagellar filament capping protein FliD [Tetrasphaera sp. HKS02]QGN58031.1 flagellar filament capping protein FliD [Tetrasphaera sp. HKS02]